MPSASSAIVGALACQKNSFLRTLQTTVLSSQEYKPLLTARDKQNKNLKKAPLAPETTQYAIELEDTVLFPEGGGQPFDTGTISLPNNSTVAVLQVLRDQLTAVHITLEPIEPGTEVTVSVDWARRLDFMQQHTGQHLLSAVFDTYGLETLSWSMGDPISYVEFGSKVPEDVVVEAGEKINALIFEALPISVVTPDEHGEPLDVSHLPEDYDKSKGIIRVVKIGLLDSNPCCGTHLSSTAQIQAISLLHQVNVRGGNSRLHFTCGSRVFRYLNKQHAILKEVQGTYLSCQLDEVVEKVGLLSTGLKKASSRELSLLKEIALQKASKIFENFRSVKSSVEYIYRPDSSPEFITLFQKEFSTLVNANKDAEVNLDKFTVVLVNGDYKSGMGGMIKILGPGAQLIVPKVAEALSNLKGGGKGNSYQGKVTKYEKGEVESLLRYLETLAV